MHGSSSAKPAAGPSSSTALVPTRHHEPNHRVAQLHLNQDALFRFFPEYLSCMSPMPPYQYAGLSTPFSIRLLVVSGSQEAPTYDIEVDIRNKPHFEALSYKWKDYDNVEPESPEEEHSHTTIAIGDVGSLDHKSPCQYLTTNPRNSTRRCNIREALGRLNLHESAGS